MCLNVHGSTHEVREGVRNHLAERVQVYVSTQLKPQPRCLVSSASAVRCKSTEKFSTTYTPVGAGFQKMQL